MRPLADNKERIARTAVERESFLRVNTAGIDDRLRLKVEDSAVFAVMGLDAGDFTAALDEAGCFNVIDRCSTKILSVRSRVIA